MSIGPGQLDESKKAKCSSCGGERNCDILASFENRGGDDFIDWCTEWRLLRCRGCELVFVQTVSSNSEDYYDYYDENDQHVTQHFETTDYWPALSKRSQPDWLSLIAIKGRDESILLRALSELYVALNNDLAMLSGIAIRTAFDAAAELLGIDPALTFKQKLEALVAEGHIGKLDLERLEALVDAGSASAHRGWVPNSEDLETLMELLEHFLDQTFVAPEKKKRLDEQAAKVRAKVPSKQAAAKAAKLVAKKS